MRDAKGRFVKAVTHTIGDTMVITKGQTPYFSIGDRCTITKLTTDDGFWANFNGHDNPIVYKNGKWAIERPFSSAKLLHKVDKSQTIYRRAVKHFGEYAQIQQATEELAELIVALSHYRRGRVVNSFVCSEIADVEIMCAQLREIFGSDAVDTEKAAKIARLAKELEK